MNYIKTNVYILNRSEMVYYHIKFPAIINMNLGRQLLPDCDWITN